MSLPAALAERMVEAHLYAPLMTARVNDAELYEAPDVAGAAGWVSNIIARVQHTAGSKTWSLKGQVPPAALADAITRCLQDSAAASSWPAAVLRGAGIDVDVNSRGGDVDVVTSRSIDLLPELLSGCALRNASAAPTGSYARVSAQSLVYRSGGVETAPLLGAIDLVATSADADVVAFGTDRPGFATLLAPFPDVLLLSQPPRVRTKDVLGLKDAQAGVLAFRQTLRADLLAAAYAQGRGAPTDALLPPGVAPARPLPEPSPLTKPTPLSLVVLPANAPRVAIVRDDQDPLSVGVVDRLALLLRNRGFAAEIRTTPATDASRPADDALEIFRWRPPTLDPALALLALAGQRPDLATDDGVRTLFTDPRLLSAKRDDRVAAALMVERAWLQSGVLVPLMSAELWFAVDADLHGVSIRPDGVPSFTHAFLGGAR